MVCHHCESNLAVKRVLLLSFSISLLIATLNFSAFLLHSILENGLTLSQMISQRILAHRIVHTHKLLSQQVFLKSSTSFFDFRRLCCYVQLLKQAVGPLAGKNFFIRVHLDVVCMQIQQFNFWRVSHLKQPPQKQSIMGKAEFRQKFHFRTKAFMGLAAVQQNDLVLTKSNIRKTLLIFTNFSIVQIKVIFYISFFPPFSIILV